MRKVETLRGSTWLGTVFLASVFGPMAALAVLWALAAGVSVEGPVRQQAETLMLWVLLVAGPILVIEEFCLILARSMFRRKHQWPGRAAVSVERPFETHLRLSFSLVDPPELDEGV